MEPRNVCIGQSIVIKGQVSASEDLMIAGRVEGTIALGGYILTFAPNAQISAEISAKTVLVAGAVKGNIVATEKIEIQANGSVEGDITAPRVVMAEGAQFRGRVDMQRAKEAARTAAEGTRPVSGTQRFPVAV